MRKLRIAIDFDDVIARTSLIKADWIEKNIPNWRKLLAKFKAEDFRATENISISKADKKGERYVSMLSSFPLWLTDRVNCISIIGRYNYEKMSYEVYGHAILYAQEIEGVREGLKEMIKKGYELFIVTYRRKEHLKFVEKWLQEKEIELFDGIHSVREFESKVQFCVENRMDVIVDDEIRALRGNAPEILKILVANHIGNSAVTRLKENGQFKIVFIMDIIDVENIKQVSKFEPYVRRAIENWLTNSKQIDIEHYSN